MNKNRKIAFYATIAPIAMFAAAFAGVPLYRIFCEQTGYGGTTNVAKTSAAYVSDKQVEISFDANHAPNLPIEFRPQQRKVDLKLGQNTLVFYKLVNNSDKPIKLIANYNVAPFKAAEYFSKLECFCFKEQTLEPNETRELPVIFFVDPRLGEDVTTKDVNNITLSYTFLEVKENSGASDGQQKEATKQNTKSL